MNEKKANSKKVKAVEELANLIAKSRSIVIVSVKNLPANQLQLIKKKLKKDAAIKIVKKSIAVRAIDSIEKGAIKNFKKYLKEDIALVFSEIEPFELSLMFSKNKSKTKAKAGQTAEEDVEIEPGLTELVPGPVISELSSLGLKFAIEDGKINIKEKKIILKKGEKVSEQAASMMAKLDMKPVAVGLEPLVAYDAEEDKFYEDIKVDQDKTIISMKEAYNKALAFAVKLAYPCKESIGLLLAKAKSHENALSKFIKIDIQGGQ